VKKVLLTPLMPIKVIVEPSCKVTVVLPPDVEAVPTTFAIVSVALFSDTRSPPAWLKVDTES